MGTDSGDSPEDCAGITQTKKHEFPWIIKFGTSRKDIISSIYQGSIISPNFIITAAYGVHDKHKTKLFCIVGINDINEYATGKEGMKVKVKDVIIHEKYKEHATGIRNNIALIKLARPLNLGKTDVDAIKLPAPGSEYNGKTAVVSGWGMNRLLNDRNGKLMKKKLRLGANKKSKVFLERSGHEKNALLCVNLKAEPPYYGDIGGPLMVKNQDGKYELAGLVSFGPILDTCVCKGSKTSMAAFYYVNVEHYIDWIRKNTEGETYLWGDSPLLWIMKNI